VRLRYAPATSTLGFATRSSQDYCSSQDYPSYRSFVSSSTVRPSSAYRAGSRRLRYWA
jgi:hypothetical protein